jgi:uncharacterized protein YcfL
MKKSVIMLIAFMILVCGCGQQQQDPRIKLQEGVASDTLGSNIVTKPVRHAFSALIGERVEVTRAVTRRNDAGFLELHVEGYNNSYNTERFQYRVEWLDDDGIVIGTKTTTWLPASAAGKSTFTITATAPRMEAVGFRMNTRNQE